MMPTKTHRVLVIAEPTSDAALTLATRSAAAFAQMVCERGTDASWSLCVNSPVTDAHDSEVRRLGAKAVYCCAGLAGSHPPAEHYAPVLARLVGDESVDLVVAAATSFGRDLLPRLAAMLDVGYVGDCTGAEVVNSEIFYLRPLHAGAVSARCRVRSTRAVVTVRASAFEPRTTVDAVSPLVPLQADCSAVAAESIEFTATVSSRPKLTEAQVVVSGGRPLGSRFVDVLGPLADTCGAALGATRALCDAGHAPVDFQVGQTGKVVAPKLYFAVGISGSVQHVAGMRASKMVVAINADRDAPIFAHADYGLVGDLFAIVPELVVALRGGSRNEDT